MNYSETLNYIFSLKTVSLKPSLDRINAALSELGNPQNSLKAIHIAGTNGKGSVASMIAEILKSTGKKVGLFISPYIIEFTERIQINGIYINKNDLCHFSEKVALLQPKLAKRGLELGQFEFITAVAFLYFKERNWDYVVLETGLGGRFDATNVIPNPICTVITKVSYDHTAVLGNTLKQITGEKAGIIKHNVPCVTSNQETEALEVITETCKKQAASLLIVDLADIEDSKLDLNGTTFSYKGQCYATSLCGVHQAENAAVAIEAVKVAEPYISADVIDEGLSKVRHPARLEVFKNDNTVIIDGAHNPDGAASLAAFLREIEFKGNLIFGGMKDKNLREVAELISPFAEKIITVTVETNPRSENAETLKELFNVYNNNVYAADCYIDALTLTKDAPTVICGSLYLAADMRRYFDKTN